MPPLQRVSWRSAASPVRFRRIPAFALLLALALTLTLTLASALALTLASSAPPPARDIAMDVSSFEHLPSRFIHLPRTRTVLLHDPVAGNLYRSTDVGSSWTLVDTVPVGMAKSIVQHPVYSDITYVVGGGLDAWVSMDGGDSWRPFALPLPPAREQGVVLDLHAARRGYAMFHGERCKKGPFGLFEFCVGEAYYTLDGFATAPVLLRKDYVSCSWAWATKEIASNEAAIGTSAETLFCIEQGDGDAGRLLRTDDFFGHAPQAVQFNPTRSMGEENVLAIGGVSKFLITAVQDTVARSVELWVSTDGGARWIQAHMPDGAASKDRAYTVVESSAASLVVDVQASTRGLHATLLRSDSHGTAFTISLPHTARQAASGIVDYERVAGIEGSALANVVTNWEDVDRDLLMPPRMQSRITVDDGATWRRLAPPTADVDGKRYPCMPATGPRNAETCSLHLHSISAARNIGRVYSAPDAPGILLGVGSVGSYLRPYELCDTFLSRDGGVTWDAVKRGPHKWEITDSGSTILLAADAGLSVREVYYSVDQGRSWRTKDLGMSVKVRAVSTDSESSTMRIVLIVTRDDADLEENELKHKVIVLDFSQYFSRQCVAGDTEGESNDFEKWYARHVDSTVNCVMGRKTAYWRRKSDRDCFVGRAFQDPRTVEDHCPCVDADYECDVHFVLDENKHCIASGLERVPPGQQCLSVGDTYMASSGYRRIPGNACDASKGKVLDQPVSKQCRSDQVVVIPPGSVKHSITLLNDEIDTLAYFNTTTAMLIRTVQGQVWRSEDDGAAWKRILLDAGSVVNVRLHEFDNRRAYAITDKNELWYSSNRGADWSRLSVPIEPNKLGIPVLDFHPTESDWLIYVGSTPCPGCHSEVYLSKDHGQNWTRITTWATQCRFGRGIAFTAVTEESIYCVAYRDKSSSTGQDQIGLAQLPSAPGLSSALNPLELVFSQDLGITWSVLLTSVVSFDVIENVLVATSMHNSRLLLSASTDGKSFADAKFPPTAHIRHQGFTLVRGSAGELLLDATDISDQGREIGQLFRSTFNASAFPYSLINTNRSPSGNVDVSALRGMEGVLLANEVANADEIRRGATKKLLRTKISYDAGRSWHLLNPPAVDSIGKDISCQGDCNLHLHGQLDLRVKSDIFDSPASAGLIMGVGSVGATLLPYEQCSFYFSRDAGKSWSEVAKGPFLHAFGDSGGLVVIADDLGVTDEVRYSWNDGRNWLKHNIGTKIRATRVVTSPGSKGMKFVITGYKNPAANELPAPIVIHIDFSGLEKQRCAFDRADESKSDFEEWKLSDATGSRCVNGLSKVYYRRKIDRMCYIGPEPAFGQPIDDKCDCTEVDFECDMNFWRDANGQCALSGLDPLRPSPCPNGSKYFGSSGYRKNPLSACVNGLDLGQKVERSCSDIRGIHASQSIFEHVIAEYFYFDESRVVVARTDHGQLYTSKDEGATWTAVSSNGGIKYTAIVKDPYHKHRAFAISEGKVHLVTNDMGLGFVDWSAPSMPSMFGVQVIQTHSKKQNTWLYIGSEDCDSPSSSCHAKVFISANDGKDWLESSSMGAYVRMCLWGHTPDFSLVHDDAIICESYRDRIGDQRSFTSNSLELILSTDQLSSASVLQRDIIGFVVNQGFMVAAQTSLTGNGMVLQVSRDAQVFATAQFPKGQQVINQAYTVLDSPSKTLALHVTTNAKKGAEWGSLYSSNWNGTYFRESFPFVNRDIRGFVDYEHIEAISGVALANQVVNTDSAKVGSTKTVATRVTFDNGLTWKSLVPPAKDSTGHAYSCQDDKCFVHLHSYTETKDPVNIFSARAAVGLMIGVGNVGHHLEPYALADTFLSRDGGVTWNEIRKGVHLHEFGDHGAILVLIDAVNPTDRLLYSIDEGKSFAEFIFTKSNEKLHVSSVTTEPLSSSRRFLIFGRFISAAAKYVTVQVDFTGLEQAKCMLDVSNPDASDFESWTPMASADSACLFGHKTTYHRRKLDRQCFIGEEFAIPAPQTENCACNASDFECDYNYARDEITGLCKLVSGLQPLLKPCNIGDVFYTLPTGYRKISMTTCHGGQELDIGEQRLCDGTTPSASSSSFSLMGALAFAAVVWIAYLVLRDKEVPESMAGAFSLARDALASIPRPSMPAFTAGWFQRRVQYTRLSQGPDVYLDDYEDDRVRML